MAKDRKVVVPQSQRKAPAAKAQTISKPFFDFSNLLTEHQEKIFKYAFFTVAILIFVIRGGNNKMSCIFCDIVDKKTDTEILFENDQFVAFRDIKPASNFHFLMIPKKHIMNTNSLTVVDKPMRKINKNVCCYQFHIKFPINVLVMDMKKYMLELMEKNNQTDLSDISLGFHIPPFNSVKHLHLHGISKKSEMRFIGRMIFRENSFWYKTFDVVFDSLPASNT